MPQDADIVIIGAGVVGLAVASEVAAEDRTVFILEKNTAFGRETSSRNSGTIHSGILSPRGSLNAALCLEGNAKIYRLCEKYSIDFRRTGKLLVACNEEECEGLEALYQRRDEGIPMQMLSQKELKLLEPAVSGKTALLLPSAGTVDAYGLMRCFLGLSSMQGVQLALESEVTGIEKAGELYRLTVRDSQGVTSLFARIVINCAGLQSDRVAALAGIDINRQGYRLNYFKGEYYSLDSGIAGKANRRLIYPMLRQGGLVAIHTVLDVDGRVRLGPDFYPVDCVDYAMDDSRKQIFLAGARKLFKNISEGDIEPESAGIMPRLYSEKEPFREYIIREETCNDLPGFINLIGIESPGLTASPAIAAKTAGMVNDILN